MSCCRGGPRHHVTMCGSDVTHGRAEYCAFFCRGEKNMFPLVDGNVFWTYSFVGQESIVDHISLRVRGECVLLPSVGGEGLATCHPSRGGEPCMGFGSLEDSDLTMLFLGVGGGRWVMHPMCYLLHSGCTGWGTELVALLPCCLYLRSNWLPSWGFLSELIDWLLAQGNSHFFRT